jgi:hypothetical protein
MQPMDPDFTTGFIVSKTGIGVKKKKNIIDKSRATRYLTAQWTF